MLADLHRIRDLQLMQRAALVDADGARLDELHEERMALQARLSPLAASGLQGADRREAERLIETIAADQDALLAIAERIRATVARDLGTMRSGRSALHGYRADRDRGGLYLDRAS